MNNTNNNEIQRKRVSVLRDALGVAGTLNFWNSRRAVGQIADRKETFAKYY